MSMVQFVEQARSAGMVKLNERIKNAMERLQYLMDTYLFEQGKSHYLPISHSYYLLVSHLHYLLVNHHRMNTHSNIFKKVISCRINSLDNYLSPCHFE